MRVSDTLEERGGREFEENGRQYANVTSRSNQGRQKKVR